MQPLLRFFVAAVLLFAALAKTHQLATMPTLPQDGWFGFLEIRRVQIVAIEFELFWALLLIFNPFPRLIGRGTAVLFVAFAVISAAKWLLGEASCGCFGRVEINPLYTAIFDAVIVGMLVLFRKHAAQNVEKPARKCVFAVLVWLAVSLPVMFAVNSVRELDLPQLGTEFIGVDGRKTVMLEPEKWVGKEFPLLVYLNSRVSEDARQSFGKGKWMVLLYHDDCEKCQRVMAEYEQLASDLAHYQLETRFALIGIPPIKNRELSADWNNERMVLFFLRDQENWNAKTPVQITLEDGFVRNVDQLFR